jgi:hypothetical protein
MWRSAIVPHCSCGAVHHRGNAVSVTRTRAFHSAPASTSLDPLLHRITAIVYASAVGHYSAPADRMHRRQLGRVECRLRICMLAANHDPSPPSTATTEKDDVDRIDLYGKVSLLVVVTWSLYPLVWILGCVHVYMLVVITWSL